ncbi:secretin N-terminal domain-containing protein [Stieleria marina]|uniref:Bacterial type II/III secretion system short domain protein n=1 Tax=Stieleria marina TaxID=1930275 RepID=A0A517P347_9BACT|nr:Bacterial type II/III secretion system short domain protein [Planctomycetes bacterium K23_9]
MHLIKNLVFVIAAVTFVFNVSPAQGDGPMAFRPGPDGKPVQVPGTGESKGGDGKDGQPKPPEKGGKKSKDDDNKEGKSPEPKIIRRGEVVDGTADADELKATVGEDGKVAFQFRNQSWVELVQWLSDITNKPLDWLELPGDRVNLASPGRYTVAETQDLFNRHLLARGFTILELDGGMTITQTKDINPAVVPRVSLAELHVLEPHAFVRTSLDIGWLSAEKMAQELTAMISTNGRLTAMTTTNRIEAMDAAINLQELARVMEQERDSASREALAPEFKLRYLPAEEAKKMLEQFLGVQEKKSAPMTPQQMQMMQQQMRNQGGKAVPTAKKVEVSIVANIRQNSVIIRAPADRVAVATEFIKRIDVPSDAMTSLADIQSRMQVFRLSSLDPEKLIEIITETNVLEPSTRLRADNENNALIVSGSAPDRFIITSLIERLDGSGRRFEVLQLRRLSPTEVAESISFLMGQKEEKDEGSSRNRYYGFYGYGGNEEEKKKTDEFRVAANERYRQVLLWASESEMEQVESLLIKLGEIPPPGGSKRTMRMVDAAATPETYEYLLKLQQQWSSTSGTPLQLPDKELFKDPIDEVNQTDDTETENADQQEEQEAARPKNSDEDDAVASNSVIKPGYLVAMQPPSDQVESGTAAPNNAADSGNAADSDSALQDDAAAPARKVIRSAAEFDSVFRPKPEPKVQKSKSSGSPIRIEVDSEGNLLLLSSDTKSLDQLEDLMMMVKPPRRPYRVFKIKFASSFWVKLNLEEYFEDAEEEDSEADRFYRWWNDDTEDEDEGPTGLGKGNPLKFVEDPDTNTIVVSGATSDQLRTISELIELWDINEPNNKRKMRFTRLVSLQYGRAGAIAETVKEAYRDLLSSNDKSFGGRGGGGGGEKGDKGDAKRKREGNGSGLVDRENGNEGGGADFSFKGKLSMGIDEVGNTLLVSAEGEDLLELITGMIEKLDLAARSAGEVEIFQLSGNVSTQSVQQALEAFGSGASTKATAETRPRRPFGGQSQD